MAFLNSRDKANRVARHRLEYHLKQKSLFARFIAYLLEVLALADVTPHQHHACTRGIQILHHLTLPTFLHSWMSFDL